MESTISPTSNINSAQSTRKACIPTWPSSENRRNNSCIAFEPLFGWMRGYGICESGKDNLVEVSFALRYPDETC
jgi:hypothetical protein